MSDDAKPYTVAEWTLARGNDALSYDRMTATVRALEAAREEARVVDCDYGCGCGAQHCMESRRCLVHQRDAAEAACAEMRGLLENDRTGLAASLGAIRDAVKKRSWLLEGRGPYEWNDDRYKDEAGRAMRLVVTLAEKALRVSGEKVRRAFALDVGKGWASPEQVERLVAWAAGVPPENSSELGRAVWARLRAEIARVLGGGP